MTAFLVILCGYVAASVAAMRPIGRWWLGMYGTLLSKSRCHGEYTDVTPTFMHTKVSRQSDCNWEHERGCWRADRTPRPRTIGTGFCIVALAFAWPVIVWPALALRLTPATDAERERQHEQLKADYEQALAELERR